MGLHRTRDGRTLTIGQMTDEHLLNTLKMQLRRAEAGITVRCGGGSSAEDMWYDEDQYQGREALEHMNFYDYYDEARFRNLDLTQLTQQLRKMK